MNFATKAGTALTLTFSTFALGQMIANHYKGNELEDMFKSAPAFGYIEQNKNYSIDRSHLFFRTQVSLKTDKSLGPCTTTIEDTHILGFSLNSDKKPHIYNVCPKDGPITYSI